MSDYQESRHAVSMGDQTTIESGGGLTETVTCDDRYMSNLQVDTNGLRGGYLTHLSSIIQCCILDNLYH